MSLRDLEKTFVTWDNDTLYNTLSNVKFRYSDTILWIVHQFELVIVLVTFVWLLGSLLCQISTDNNAITPNSKFTGIGVSLGLIVF